MSHAYERDPAAIYAQSFATIRAEADLSHLPPAAHPLAIRVIHACGMVEVADALSVSEGAVETGRAALAGGAPILCDVQMVARGVIASRLPAANEIVCLIDDPRLPDLAASMGATRSAAQVALWRERMGGAVVAIGNAPTALFALLEAIEAGAPPPALVIGMPVGFVGAVESKEALAASGLPHAIVRGRRGGSAMAAAAVNALAGSGEEAGGESGEVAPSAGRTTREPAPRIRVIGTPADGALDTSARAALDGADMAFAPARLAEGHGPCVRRWPSPLSEGLDEIERERARGRRVAVLATGDPMHFGIGGTLARRLGADALDVRPAPSAFSLAASRFGWPLEVVGCLSLHGRAEGGRGVDALAQWAAPERRLLALSADGETPAAVARWLTARGLGASRLAVLERMGAEGERIRAARADAFDLEDVDPLNTIGIECVARPGAVWHPLAAGLPDDAFEHDGRITKRDVRAMTLSRLRPRPGGVLWDVGAGSGAVGIEWLRLSPAGGVHAVEPREDRRGMIARNAAAFGLPGIEIVAGSAPDALDGLPRPDAIFIGGGIDTAGVAEGCVDALPPGGTLVANAVTLEGEACLAALHAEHGGDLVRVQLAHADAIGAFRGWRAAMPVTLWSWEKGREKAQEKVREKVREKAGEAPR